MATGGSFGRHARRHAGHAKTTTAVFVGGHPVGRHSKATAGFVERHAWRHANTTSGFIEHHADYHTRHAKVTGGFFGSGRHARHDPGHTKATTGVEDECGPA